jgi:hypothetical protein
MRSSRKYQEEYLGLQMPAEPFTTLDGRKFVDSNLLYEEAPELEILQAKKVRSRKALGKPKFDRPADLACLPVPKIPLQSNSVEFSIDNLKLQLDPPPDPRSLYNCVRGYVEGQTSGKIFHKIVTCGKENCSTCGADYSITHNRRVNRAYSKIAQLKSVGYLVVTVPEELREAFLSKRVLKDFRNYIRRKLKEGTYIKFDATDVKTGKLKKMKLEQKDSKRGLIRYHWCGEDVTTWKPHLNILMEAGYWEQSRLEIFRADVARWFKAYFNLDTYGNIYYAYSRKPEKIKHWLKYVLRSTAKKVRDVKILDTIYGYQNTGYFGKFEKVEIERDAATAILSGCDPDTGEIIKWMQMIKASEFNTIYRRKAERITIQRDPDKPPIDYGLYVTEKINLLPPGTQIDVFSFTL